MQVPAPFDYERATSIDHAISLMDRLGDEARLVAGGHSLIPMMKLRLADLEYLIDINDLHDELGYVRVGVDEVRIGAMTRHRELLESAELAAVFPIFADAERVIADPVVRNRGTIGGSLCQADPSEDLSAVCTTLDASCVIRGSAGERVVPMEDFHLGPYETAVGQGEILIEVRMPGTPGRLQRLRQGRAAGRRLGGHRGRRRGLDRRRRDHRRPGRAGRRRAQHDRHPGDLRAAARPGDPARSSTQQAGALAGETAPRPPTTGDRRVQAAPRRRADQTHPAHRRRRIEAGSPATRP